MTADTLILRSLHLTRLFAWSSTSLFFQRASIKNVAFEKLHIWQNNTYIKQIEEDKSAMVQHHSCPDSERDHKLLRPLTFTLIKGPTPLLNFFSPHCFLMWGRHFVAWAFLFVVSWRNLTNTVKNKLLLFLLDMTLTLVWLLMVSDDLVNLFVCTFHALLLCYCTCCRMLRVRRSTNVTNKCNGDTWFYISIGAALLVHWGQHLWQY